jgi:hypothetical protein
VAALVSSPALAQAPVSGLAVHLDAGARALQGPVVLTFETVDGERSQVTLTDDGAPPDVVAADGLWGGAGVVSGVSQAVTLTAGEFTATGTVTPTVSDSERNLELLLQGESLVAGQPFSLPAGEPTGETPPVAAVTPVATAAAPAPAERSDVPVYLAIVGAGLLLALLGYFLVSRRPGDDAWGALPIGVRRAPALGHLGPGTPSLAPGLSCWVVGAEEQAELLQFLVAHLARSVPVLVQSQHPAHLARVWGSSVFLTGFDEPADLADAVEDLLSAHPGLVVLTQGVAAGDLPTWTQEIANAVPVWAMVTTHGALAGAVVTCQRTGDGWTFDGDSGETVVGPTPPQG